MEEKKIEGKKYECTNCSWSGIELSKSCKTKGNLTKDGKHLNGKRCSNCGFLDDKCPICGDEVGELGSRAKAIKEKADEEKEKLDKLRGKAIY